MGETATTKYIYRWIVIIGIEYIVGETLLFSTPAQQLHNE